MPDKVLQEVAERLEDSEYRQAYGSINIKYDLAVTLGEARKSKDLTQAQLAALAGVSQAYIAKLESGEANPTIEHIGALLAALGLRLKFQIRPLIASNTGSGYFQSPYHIQ